MELITNLATSKGSEHVCEVLYLFYCFCCTNFHLFLHLSSYFLHSCMFDVLYLDLYNTGPQFLDNFLSKSKILVG
jgi:hypothetical protein